MEWKFDTLLKQRLSYPKLNIVLIPSCTISGHVTPKNLQSIILIYLFFYRGHSVIKVILYQSCKKSCKPVETYKIEKNNQIFDEYVFIKI